MIFFVGCTSTSHSDPQIMSLNKTTLSRSGEDVGTLPDGRKVVRYEIEMGSSIHNHWLYVVDGSITVNRAERQGKGLANHVDVIIDGTRYEPIENRED